MTDKTKLQALQASRLGADLDERECGVLCELVTVRELADQEVLVREDTIDNHLYVVADGTLGVVRNINSDQRLTIATLGAGDLAGELSFIDATKRHASLVALGRTRVLGLEREHFESLADEPPASVLSRDPRDCPNRAHNPAASVAAGRRAVELHLQTARSVLKKKPRAKRGLARRRCESTTSSFRP